MTAKNSTFGPVNPAPLSLPMWRLWTGRVLSGLPVLSLLMSASMKLSHSPMVVETFVGKLGYPANILPALAALELFCTVVYVVPRTAVLGAVLLTGYLGGAVATHVRVGEAFAIPLVLGVLLWAGLYLRDERIGALLPLRKVAR
jgi:hypothetical protein